MLPLSAVSPLAQELENVSMTGSFEYDYDSDTDVSMAAQRPATGISPTADRLKAQADLAQLG